MKSRVQWMLFLLVGMTLFGVSLEAQDGGISGYWKEPQGSVIHVEACGSDVCATLVEISRSAPGRVDANNPDPTLRQRSLCGLRIGTGFHLTSPVKAEGGSLYDPKSGKTYHGLMTVHGDELNLRGFIGFAVFGRSEKWSRTAVTNTCRS